MAKSTRVHDLHKQGLTVLEIAKETGLKPRSITSMINRSGKSVNRHRKIESDELEQFIRGSVLGDAHICKRRTTNAESYISFQHGPSQEEYLRWKWLFLNKYDLVHLPPKEVVHISDRYKNGECHTFQFFSKVHPIFTKFRSLYYEEGIKYINIEDIENINEFALAIWYMDDGNIWKRKGRSDCLTINTTCFSKNDNLFVINLFQKKWDILSTYNKTDNSIRISAKSADRFIEIVKPYIVKCMEYKMVLYKSDELLEAFQNVGNQQPSLIDAYLKSIKSRRFND